MKIVEDYAQRIANAKVEESMKQTVLNMFDEGFSIEEIVRGTKYNLDFVKDTLSNY